MKKILIIIAILALSTASFAQSTKINNAFQDYRRGRISRALEAIEDAAVHPDTKDQARTWFYRGNIFLTISLSDKADVKALSDNAIDEAYMSYQKAIELDKTVSNNMVSPSSPSEGVEMLSVTFYNRGIKYYNTQNYVKAAEDFEKAYRCKADNGFLYMLGLSQMYGEIFKPKEEPKNLRSAITTFNGLVQKKYEEPNIYIFLSDLFKMENDTVRALRAINNGEKAYPDTTRIMIQKFNIYLWSGQTEEALKLLQQIKEKEPTNHVVYFNIGTVLNEIGNFDEAIIAFERAIELKPDYFDALFNFGTMYFNKFLSIREEADKLGFSEQDKFEKLNAQAQEILAKARPYLEKCYELNPKDHDTLYMLRQVYIRMNELTKAKEIEQLMNDLK
ncbi:MAG: tetratricopeptide repeat protein [Bacteroidales bacterium]|nr:tetratricopeptide repeat protein [Bacteroidales bacterium]